MVYTYQNVMDEAQRAGVLEKFSPEDLTTAQKNPEYGMALVGLLKDESKAATETQKLIAGESMAKLRRSYGITGAGSASAGSSFSTGQSMSAPTAAGTPANSAPTTYAEAVNDIVNMPSFSYNHENDPTYQAYAKQYLREGRRASEDTLAQMAAMTGGRVSSAALTTAQQVANQYAAELSDMVPALRQNAYSEYQNDRADKYDVAAALKAKEDTDYQREQDRLNRETLADETAYRREQDRLNRETLADETAYQREQNIISNALLKYQALGYATPDVAEILGIPEGYMKPTYRPTNQAFVKDGKTVFKVGGSELTQAEIDKAIAAGEIKVTYDNKAGTVTYEWVEGKDPTPDPLELNLTNEMGGVAGREWIQIDGVKVPMTTFFEGADSGLYIPKRDANTGLVTWVKTSRTGMGKSVYSPSANVVKE